MTVVLWGWLGVAWAAAPLPPPIERILAGHDIDPSLVSIIVQPVGAQDPLLSHLPKIPRNPASVMKLVTTWTALEVLGPAYTWPTEVYFLGDVDDGTLNGDLGLKGYGDPFLVIENFWKLLRAVRGLGVKRITGDLLFDDSYFEIQEPPPGAFDGRPSRAYNVVPDAMLVNFETVTFNVQVAAASDDVAVTMDPSLPNVHLKNRIRLGSGRCGGYHYGVTFDVVDSLNSRVVLGGRFPASCGSYRYSFVRSVLKPPTYAYGLFKDLWKELGGNFTGKLRATRIPSSAVPALIWQSPPLADILRSINKFSNNLMARQVFYTLGAVERGAPGTPDKALEVIRDHLAASGIDTTGFVMKNGAGLSREGRVTARMIADLLLRAHAGPYAAEFISSLPLAGLDGTARVAFSGLPQSDGIHVKTGTLDQVSALAGYVRAKDGTDYVVVILMNAPNADRGYGHELENATLRWVISQARVWALTAN